MKKKFSGCKKKLALGFLTAALCALQPVQMVMATMHYDRRQTVAEEQFQSLPEAYSAQSAASTASKNAWKKVNGVCYNGSGKPIPGAITRGIDVSEWQETINWTKVKGSDVDFAFVRIAYGLDYMDKKYDYNMKQAELAGVPVGTYVYSTATSTAGALKEAQLAINKMKGYKVSYPVAYDLEDASIQKLSAKTIAKMALTFCNEVRAAGYYPIVYCNTYWYDNFIDWSMLSGVNVWIARYGDTIQAPDAEKYSYTIWQSTDGNAANGLNTTKGLIAGIPTWNDIDLNFGYVDYTKIITPRWEPASSYTPADSPNTGSYGSSQEKNGWKEEDGNTYYYVNGQKTTGWKVINNKKYFFDEETGSLYKDKLFQYAGQTYYVDGDGVMYANKWLTDYKGKTYYFKASGAAFKGMKRVNGKYYWFHTSQGYIYKNRKVIRSTGDIYYFGSDGVRCEDEIKTITEKGVPRTYYFQKDGKAYKGWLTYKGKKYYFYKGNSALSGTRAENITLTSSQNIVSVFDKLGVCIKQYKK